MPGPTTTGRRGARRATGRSAACQRRSSARPGHAARRSRGRGRSSRLPVACLRSQRTRGRRGRPRVKELLQAKNAIASGLVVIGESTFHNNVYIMSGSTFDGIDPGSLRFLLDGSNADWDPIDLIQGHRHSSFVEISGTTVGLIPFAPVYHMKTDSGQVLPTQYYDPTTESNLEKVVIDGADQEISQMKIFRIPVPDDFISFSGINIRHAEDIDGLTKVNLQLLDTSGEIIDLYPNQIFKPSATLEYEKVFPVEQIYNVIDPGQFLTFTYDYRVASGTSQSIDYTAEILLYYNRV